MAAVTLMGKLLAVGSIVVRWVAEEYWWRSDSVVRVTYRVSLDGGQELTIFENLLHRGRYRV